MFKLSQGNSKLGRIFNANLPAIVTCIPNAPCAKDCYACKGTFCFPVVKARYAENLAAWEDNHELTKLDILSQLKGNKAGYFRWHASGDIPEMDYLSMMVQIAEERPNIQFLAFTKKFDMINDYIRMMDCTKITPAIPSNLNIVFSIWEGLACENVFGLPTATVYEHRLIQDGRSYPCQLSCVDCKICWNLKEGEQVVFHKH